MTVEYSVVIPLKNEEENVLPLINEIEPVMNRVAKNWELIAVDDGSTDQTLKVLETLQQEKPYLQILSFDRNYGQSSAFDAGFKSARGEFVITLDGDQQNDPNDIPHLIEAMDGHDMIVGNRVNRKDPWSKKFSSLFANSLRRAVVKDGVSDTGCSLKIYRKSSLQKIPLFNGMHRFLPALFLINGFTVTEQPVNHRERTRGKSKYNLFNRSLNTLWDLFAVAWMRSRTLKYQVINKD